MPRPLPQILILRGSGIVTRLSGQEERQRRRGIRAMSVRATLVRSQRYHGLDP
jgi:hypothetical protein